VGREFSSMAEDLEMTVVAWSSLHNGLLAGHSLATFERDDINPTRLNPEMMKVGWRRLLQPVGTFILSGL
jgi:aryl-alcohol dehydrogenase-like predicted oxidoreductase